MQFEEFVRQVDAAVREASPVDAFAHESTARWTTRARSAEVAVVEPRNVSVTLGSAGKAGCGRPRRRDHLVPDRCGAGPGRLAPNRGVSRRGLSASRVPHAQALIPTADPSTPAAAMVRRLAPEFETEWSAEAGYVRLDEGICTFHSWPEGLRLDAFAPSSEKLGHVERFIAQQLASGEAPLNVDWRRRRGAA